MGPILEIHDLTTRFYTRAGVVKAVNGISFSLAEGDILGVVGESGSGKSVSMLSIMRLLPEPPGKVDTGHALFNGKDLLQLSEEQMRHVRGREIAMVFQDPMSSLNPVLTIGYQLTEVLHEHLGLNKVQAMKQAVELLSLVEIPSAKEHMKDFPHQFSGGMRQRVMIAMALACSPSLLIADEPTTALDVTVQAQIIELVRQLQAKLGMTVIWITHDLGVVARLAKRVIVMYAGGVVEDAPVRELFKHPGHPYTMGLLGSLPNPDGSSDSRLVSIPGQPPDLVNLPDGCPFAPRCSYKVDRCLQEKPILIPLDPMHTVACWETKRTSEKWQNEQ